MFVLCGNHCVLILCFKYSEIAVILPFDMWVNTTVNFSQHKTAGAVACRTYRRDSPRVIIPAYFLHLQPCFGRFRSSRRNGKRSTIQNPFSKHQRMCWGKKKEPLFSGIISSQESMFCLYSWQFSELVNFLSQHLSGAYLVHSSIYTALLLPHMV